MTDHITKQDIMCATLGNIIGRVYNRKDDVYEYTTKHRYHITLHVENMFLVGRWKNLGYVDRVYSKRSMKSSCVMDVWLYVTPLFIDMHMFGEL